MNNGEFKFNPITVNNLNPYSYNENGPNLPTAPIPENETGSELKDVEIQKMPETLEKMDFGFQASWYQSRKVIHTVGTIFTALSALSFVASAAAVVAFIAIPIQPIIFVPIITTTGIVAVAALIIGVACLCKSSFLNDPEFLNEERQKVWDKIKTDDWSYETVSKESKDLKFTEKEFNTCLYRDASTLTYDEFKNKHGESVFAILDSTNQKFIGKSLIKTIRGINEIAPNSEKYIRLTAFGFDLEDVRYSIVADQIKLLDAKKIDYVAFISQNKGVEEMLYTAQLKSVTDSLARYIQEKQFGWIKAQNVFSNDFKRLGMHEKDVAFWIISIELNKFEANKLSYQEFVKRNSLEACKSCGLLENGAVKEKLKSAYIAWISDSRKTIDINGRNDGELLGVSLRDLLAQRWQNQTIAEIISKDKTAFFQSIDGKTFSPSDWTNKLENEIQKLSFEKIVKIYSTEIFSKQIVTTASASISQKIYDFYNNNLEILIGSKSNQYVKIINENGLDLWAVDELIKNAQTDLMKAQKSTQSLISKVELIRDQKIEMAKKASASDVELCSLHKQRHVADLTQKNLQDSVALIEANLKIFNSKIQEASQADRDIEKLQSAIKELLLSDLEMSKNRMTIELKEIESEKTKLSSDLNNLKKEYGTHLKNSNMIDSLNRSITLSEQNLKDLESGSKKNNDKQQQGRVPYSPIRRGQQSNNQVLFTSGVRRNDMRQQESGQDISNLRSILKSNKEKLELAESSKIKLSEIEQKMIPISKKLGTIESTYSQERIELQRISNHLDQSKLLSWDKIILNRNNLNLKAQTLIENYKSQIESAQQKKNSLGSLKTSLGELELKLRFETLQLNKAKTTVDQLTAQYILKKMELENLLNSTIKQFKSEFDKEKHQLNELLASEESAILKCARSNFDNLTLS